MHNGDDSATHCSPPAEFQIQRFNSTPMRQTEANAERRRSSWRASPRRFQSRTTTPGSRTEVFAPSALVPQQPFLYSDYSDVKALKITVEYGWVLARGISDAAAQPLSGVAPEHPSGVLVEEWFLTAIQFWINPWQRQSSTVERQDCGQQLLNELPLGSARSRVAFRTAGVAPTG